MKKEQSVWVSAVVIIGVLTDVAAAGTITIIPAVLLWRIRPLPAGTGAIPAVRETVFPRRREAAAALPSPLYDFKPFKKMNWTLCGLQNVPSK